MASNEKNFKVKLGVTTPKVDYTLGDNVITAEMLDLATPTLSYSGTSGQLFSISDDLTGTIFSVNDISGVPSIEVNADGTVSLAGFNGNVGIGTISPLEKLHVDGDIRVNNRVYSAADLELGANSLSVLYVKSSGEVGIGIDLPTNTLDVNGTARVRTITNATGDFATVSATGVLQKRTPVEVLSDIGAVSSSHTHTESDITDLGNYSVVGHSHAISDVTSLQSSLDGKVDENAAITAGTATKITYDAKGLVTSGASLLAGDLPSHTHTKANITDFAHTHPVSEISNATTVGQNLVTTANPSAIRFLRVNADNTTSLLTDSDFRTAIGAGSGGGTVTSVAAGNGLDFTTITATGSVTLGTPSSLNGSTTNSVTATSHTHAISLTAADVGAAATSHAHGNITSAGAIGTTTDQVVTTTTSGVLTTSSRSGIDSRVSFPPSSHVHGNITNAGAIGAVADLVAVTTTSGVLTTASRSGIDSRSTFPPDTHTHTRSEITDFAHTHTISDISDSTTIGQNLVTLTNPGAITFPRFNANNTVDSLAAADFRTAIGAGTSSTVGTVTSVGGTGTVAGISLSGTVTSSGNLTLGGSLSTPISTINDSTTVGQNLVKLTNPDAISFLRINALNTVDALDATSFRTAIGAGTSSTTGTVTSVSAGDGLDFTAITGSGSVTLGTPGTITGASTNSVTATSHTHALTLSDLTAGTGLTSTGTYNGSTARTFSIDSTVATLTGSQALTNKTYNGLTLTTAANTFTLTSGTSTLVRSGAHAMTLTTTAATNVTFPTTGTLATTAQIPTVNNGTLTLATSGTGISGSASFTANQSSGSTFTVTSNATNVNTVSTIVARDASGNFSAGTITASLSGNATTATTASATTAAATFNNGGAGAASGTTFNGSTARTISYNTVGAAAASHTHTVSEITDFPTEITEAEIDAGTASTTRLITGRRAQYIVDKAVASVSGGITWTQVTGTSQAISIDTGYIANNAARVSFSLPATAALGSVARVAGLGAGGWRVTQGTGQIVYFGNTNTTSGTGGYLESTHQRDSIELLCVVANTTWQVISSTGNIEVV